MSILTNIQNIVSALTAFSTVYLGVLTYRRSNEVRILKEKNEYLKKTVHKITSKVDPESDRRLIVDANSSIQIMGINSLGPMHHCREEIIEFLKKPDTCLNIILLDIRSEVFTSREEFEEDNSSRLITEWKATLSILKDIHEKSGGRIELRLRCDEPNRSLLIIDSMEAINDKSKMLINYYPEQQSMRGYEGVQFLSEYVMERDRDSFYKNREFYIASWKNSESVSLQTMHQQYVENNS